MSTSGSQVHIDARQLLTTRRRFADTLATGLMWILYSYLWAPLVSLLAWLLGIEFAYDVMVRAGGAKGLVDVLKWYGVVLVFIFVVVVAWSGINRFRFAERERRKAVADLSDAEIAEHYRLVPDSLATIRASRISKVSIGPDAEIRQIRDMEKESGLI